MAVRVVIGEDSLLVREGITKLLGLRDDVELLESCADLPMLSDAVARHRPVVLDDPLEHHDLVGSVLIRQPAREPR